MLITLITQEKIHTLALPEKIEGRYWLFDPALPQVRPLAIEAEANEWVLQSNRYVYLPDMKQVALRPHTIYTLYCQADQKQEIHIYVEPITEDRKTYKKLAVRSDDQEIKIGRERGNIIVNNRYVSSEHAKLICFKGQWSVFDEQSTNGTFVNGKRVASSNLSVGDVIYIMGFKIIIGGTFLALNNPDGQVNLPSHLPVYKTEVAPLAEDEEYEELPQEYFYRSPRFKRDLEKAEIRIDPPPQTPVRDELPVMLTVGPAMTMGMASMTTAIFAVNRGLESGNMSSAIPSIVMSCSMLLGSLLWPTLSRRYEKRRQRRLEGVRQEKYREYLQTLADRFKNECAKQKEILLENHVTLGNCLDRISEQKRDLWERGPGQNDFLTLRLGLGNGKLQADLAYPEKRFSLADDDLEAELYKLCESPKDIKEIPITISLWDNFIMGVIGARRVATEFARGLIMQIASLYSYDEVKLVFILSPDEEEDFRFTKWLPHAWDDEHNFRFLAANESEMKEVSARLEKEWEKRLNLNEREREDIAPYYVIFSLNKNLARMADGLKQIYQSKEKLGVSVVTFYDELRFLPKECTKVVEVERNNGKIFDKNDISGAVTAFFPDVFMKTSPLNYSLRLANTELGSAADRYDLPDMLTFLEMFGVGKVEHLNALTRWRESDPVKTLEAPVGVDGLGGLFKLDLHEKYHGPHGLVAGMTGSGKSEFIIAYILSLAVCYHPHEVAFILIDYKGGGMAKSFEKLPHTAGIITNLDGAAIKRSLVSIESELKRRQAIFAAAGQSTGMSNIDIYRYQRIYREGKVTEPLQHLFIISDEFAELKTQQPEFMAQLVSTARIGRSLGVHLILATQKPSGVVDDQIWSNSKFRVCLKVQERADSMDMLKRPDAAELTKTGRFYLQVGYNEFFEMGQSAWAGAPYYPAERVQSVKDHSVVVIDRNGRTLREAQLEKKKIQNPPKQLDMITAYLKETADREGICVRPLWLPPLPELLLFDDLRQRYNTVEKPFVLEPVVGEYDDPVKQSQDLLRLPLEGNVILYGATGSGKTTFLFTMIYALITGHAPTEVQLYLLDFAAETLRAFARAPHVGDVALLQETEKVGNLFKLLKKELDQRKKNMSNYGGDWRMMPENMRPPALVVIINNISAFSEAYEDKEDALAYFAREGGKYGIFFMLTASGTSAVRFRMLQNFRHVLTLQLNDENDYSVVVGKTDGLTPSRSPGRGLVKLEGVHEFQTAALTPDEGSFAFVQARCEALRETWQGAAASKIPILPDTVDHEFLWEHYTGEGLPIGVETSSLKVYLYPFQSTYLTPVLSVGEESQRFLRDVATLLALGGKELIYLEADPPAQYADFPLNTCLNAAMCEESVNKLYDLVLYRNNTYKESLENGVDCEEFPEQWVLLSGLNSIRNMLTDDGREKLALFLGKGDQRFHITVIIAEQPHTIAGFALEKWYKDRITGVDGVWVGGGITEQYNLKPAKITADMRAEQTGQFGYALSRGKAVRLKLLSEEWEEV